MAKGRCPFRDMNCIASSCSLGIYKDGTCICAIRLIAEKLLGE